MSRVPRVRRLSVLTGLSEHCWQAPPAGPPGTWALVRAAARHRLAAQAPPITALARRNE
jgi:hypothetical protein